MFDRHGHGLGDHVRIELRESGDALRRDRHLHPGGFGEQTAHRDLPVRPVAEPDGQVVPDRIVEPEPSLIDRDARDHGDHALGHAPHIPGLTTGFGVVRPRRDETVVAVYLHIPACRIRGEGHGRRQRRRIDADLVGRGGLGNPARADLAILQSVRGARGDPATPATPPSISRAVKSGTASLTT